MEWEHISRRSRAESLAPGFSERGVQSMFCLLMGLRDLPGAKGVLRFAWHLVVCAAVGCSGQTGGTPWDYAKPNEVGVSEQALETLRDSLEARNTTSFLLAKDGYLIFEWSAPEADGRHSIASVAKGILGSVTLQRLADDTGLSLDEKAAENIPAWAGKPAQSRITLRHLGSHTSGIPHRPEGPGSPDWAEPFWDRDPAAIEMLLDEPAIRFQPGSRYHYSGPGFAVLSYIATALARELGYPDLETYYRERIAAPLGIPDDSWSMSYGMSFPTRGHDVKGFWGGSSFTPRAAARVGQLVAQKGRWGGRQLIDSGTVADYVYPSRTAPELPPWHPLPAIGWWGGLSTTTTALPCDAVAAVGAGHRIVLVVPSLQLVAVRFGGSLGGGRFGSRAFWEGLADRFLTPLARAVHPDTVPRYGCEPRGSGRGD